MLAKLTVVQVLLTDESGGVHAEITEDSRTPRHYTKQWIENADYSVSMFCSPSKEPNAQSWGQAWRNESASTITMTTDYTKM